MGDHLRQCRSRDEVLDACMQRRAFSSILVVRRVRSSKGGKGVSIYQLCAWDTSVHRDSVRTLNSYFMTQQEPVASLVNSPVSSQVLARKTINRQFILPFCMVCAFLNAVKMTFILTSWCHSNRQSCYLQSHQRCSQYVAHDVRCGKCHYCEHALPH